MEGYKMEYNLKIFPNGRVVFYKEEDIDAAIESGQELAIVCTAWSGGYAYLTGANKVPNYYVHEDDPDFGKDCFECYGDDIRNQEFTTDELKRFYKVIFSDGFMVFMQTGGQANSYQGGRFADLDSKYDESIHRFETSEKDFNEMRFLVDEKRVVRDVFRLADGEEKLDALIACGILSKDARKYEKEVK